MKIIKKTKKNCKEKNAKLFKTQRKVLSTDG